MYIAYNIYTCFVLLLFFLLRIYYYLAHGNALALLWKPKRESRRPIMDCGGKHPSFNLTFFQHLNVWEFIAGMFSCTMKGKSCYV